MELCAKLKIKQTVAYGLVREPSYSSIQALVEEGLIEEVDRQVRKWLGVPSGDAIIG